MANIGEGEELLFALRKDEQKLPFVMVHSSDPHNNFGGKSADAETSLRRITGPDQKNVLASELLATLYTQTARDPQAVKLYRQILKWEPKRTATMNQLAWLLAVSVNQDVRDGAEALRLATAACEATERKQPGYLGASPCRPLRRSHRQRRRGHPPVHRRQPMGDRQLDEAAAGAVRGEEGVSESELEKAD